MAGCLLFSLTLDTPFGSVDQHRDSMSSPFGEPPLGIDLSENQMPQINATVIALCVLAAFVVALRFFTKIKVQRTGISEDDWLILGSLVAYFLLHKFNEDMH